MNLTTINADRLFGHAVRPIVDVRSPGEFAAGHIPGAVSVPLFDDEQRAEIGTLYRNAGQEPAIVLGTKIGNAKTDYLLERIGAETDGGEFALHCWRGGMRSQGVAELCKDNGLRPVVIDGGYKAFRRHAHASFERPHKILLLAGQTGAGKTAILSRLREEGQQVIDLEALANHRGSAFGGLGQGKQPTVEQFENDLFMKWRLIDPSRPVWIEGESQSIGSVRIPRPFFTQMIAGTAVVVEVDRDERVRFLLRDYGDLPRQDLADAMSRLRKRLGGERLQRALDALERDDLDCFTKIALEYYDKYYLKSFATRTSTELVKVPMACSADERVIPKLIAIAESQ